MFLLFSIFHFYSPSDFTFTLQILFDLALHLLFYLYLCYCIYYHFYNYLSRAISWANFFDYFFDSFIKGLVLNFNNSYFNLLSYSIIYHRAHVFGTLWRCLFWLSLVWLTLSLASNETWVVPETVYSLQWYISMFSTFKESCIINV